MKKIISLILATLMVCLAFTSAFATGSPSPTPDDSDTVTVYNPAADKAADAAKNLVVTPAEAYGKEGFYGKSAKFTVTGDGVTSQTFALPIAAAAGDTYYVYYYVAEAIPELFIMPNGEGVFHKIDSTVGYHVAVINADRNTSSLVFHHKGLGEGTANFYIGSVLVREGTVTQARKFDVKTELNATAGANAGWVVDDGYEVDLNVNTGGLSRFLDTPYQGKKMTLIMTYEIKQAMGGLFLHGHWTGNFVNIPSTVGVHTVAVTVDNAWYFNFHCNSGDSSTVVVKSVEMLDPDTTEWTFTPEQLWNGSVGTVTEEGLYITGAELLATQTAGGGYAQWTTATNVVPSDITRSFIMNYEIKGADIPGLHLHGYFGFQYIANNTVGEYTYEVSLSNFSLLNFHINAGVFDGDIVIKSLTIGNPGGNPVKGVNIPEYAEKLALTGTPAVFTESFDADNVYVSKFIYTVNDNATVAPTVTIGNKVVALEKTAGTYEKTIAIVGGASSIVVDAGDAGIVSFGGITYYEAGEEYQELIAFVETLPTNKTLKIELDCAIATTADTAEALVEAVLKQKIGHAYEVVSVKLVNFVKATEEATVATASAAAKGSVTVEVEIIEKATNLPYTTTLTFDLVEADVSATIPTGDAIALVAISAIIAVITLAGVAIAKKKSFER